METNQKRIVLLWLGILLVIGGIHGLTLTISPTVWMDEVQIIEYGRATVFERPSDWSMNWTTDNRPTLALWYIGAAAQELGVRLFGPSPAGPRLSSLLGALAAGTILLAWLIARGVKPRVAAGLALLFLLDPRFVQDYRGGRVDSWAIAAALASCLLLRHAVPKSTLRIFVAGVMLALALFVWPSSTLLWPLVGVELLSCISASGSEGRRHRISTNLAVFFAGALILTAVAVLPLIPTVASVIADTNAARQVSMSVGGTAGPSRWLRNVLSVVWLSPLLPFMAVTIVRAKEKLLSAATLIAVVAALASGFFVGRYVYLLPYFAAVCGAGLGADRRVGQPGKLATWALTACLAWTIGLSLVARPALALASAQERDPNSLVAAGRMAIGEGPKTVFLEGFDFYYAGRSLGWKMFRPCVPAAAQAELAAILAKVDFAVMADPPQGSGVVLLRNSGLARVRTILPRSSPHPTGLGSLFGCAGYGPFAVFARVRPTDRTTTHMKDNVFDARLAPEMR